MDISKDKIINRYFTAIYSLLLALSLGIILTQGFIVAPVIFNSINYISTPLSRLEEGKLMTMIFVRGNLILKISGFYIFFYELFFMFIERERRDRIAFLLSAISCAMIIIFAMYQTPYIIEAQKLGEKVIESEEFKRVHDNAELIYKILFASLFLLFLKKFSNKD